MISSREFKELGRDIKQRGFFDEYDRLKRLSLLGDPLEKITRTINWEIFRPILNKAFQREESGLGCRPSKVRSRVEHVFGYMSNSMGGTFIRCIGIRRAESEIAFKNLGYNLSRFAYLVHAQRTPVA